MDAAFRYSRLVGRSLIGKRVFVASPGDVAVERKLVSAIVDEFNSSDAFDQGTAFFVRGWEHLSGTVVQRPQQTINELALQDCDYVVLILGARWGSPPQLGEGFDSGTEEEFFEALRLLADPASPMRDILILFKDLGNAASEDDQARKVREFRDRLERSKEVLFNVFDSEFTFGRYVRGALRQWADQGIEPFSKAVTLPETISLDVINPDQSVSDLVALATAKADAGLAVQAEALFDAATIDGDADALAVYAKFMRRVGRYARSIELNRRILSSPDVAGGTDPESASRRAMALAGIGIVLRKIGELDGSRGALEEASREAALSGDVTVEAYVSDNLAYTFGQLGEITYAAEAFQRSEDLRRGLTGDQKAAALVNAARNQLRLRNRDNALRMVQDALRDLAPDGEAVLYATAKALEARVLFEQGNYSECVKSAEESLAANEQAKDDDGSAICESLLAQSHLALGDTNAARRYASSSLKRGVKSGNKVGEASGYWNLAKIQAADGDSTEVAELIDSALGVAVDADNIPLQDAIRRWFERYVDERPGATAPASDPSSLTST